MLTLSSVVAFWAGCVFPLALRSLSGPSARPTQVTRVKRVALLRGVLRRLLPSCGGGGGKGPTQGFFLSIVSDPAFLHGTGPSTGPSVVIRQGCREGKEGKERSLY